MQRNALLFGLTLNEFLYENPLLFYLYQDLYIEKTRIENIKIDERAWQEGYYFLRAFRQGLKDAGFIKGGGDATKYPTKPLNEFCQEADKSAKADIIKQKVLARAKLIEEENKK